MATNNDANKNRWVDERLRSLNTPEVEPNLDAARGRLHERDASARRQQRAWTTAAMIVGAILVLAALPWPRAAAQRLWDRLTLVRVEVVPVAQDNLRPEKLFDFKEEGDEPINVQDVVEAERIAGFRPLLPPPEVVPGTPQLKVVKHEVMSSTVRVADLERALAASGVTGVRVPREWEGVTLRVER